MSVSRQWPIGDAGHGGGARARDSSVHLSCGFVLCVPEAEPHRTVMVAGAGVDGVEHIVDYGGDGAAASTGASLWCTSEQTMQRKRFAGMYGARAQHWVS